MHIDAFLHRSNLGVDAADVQERGWITAAKDCSEALAQDGKTGGMTSHLQLHVKCVMFDSRSHTHLANTHNGVRHISVERLGESMSLSDDGVDKIDLQPHPLEEEVTACGITVALYIELRQVWLGHRHSTFYKTRNEH